MDDLKAKTLFWASKYPYCLFLDNCGSQVDVYGQYELLLGVSRGGPTVEHYATWQGLSTGKWLMGGIPYDLKNRFEPTLPSPKAAMWAFPEVAFFEPSVIAYVKRGSQELVVEGEGSEDALAEILATPLPTSRSSVQASFASHFTREAYMEAIESVRRHIYEGDVYELNLSQLFQADAAVDSPAMLFRDLIDISPVPFAAYFRYGKIHVCCASPERFLQLRSGRLITQPIKGTAPRSADPVQDEGYKQALRDSPKEQAENVMIVDLSRHDLHRSCETHSVHVPHLYEVQSFAKVHQLVSTIAGRLRPDLGPLEAIRRSFPPGSMTGAPKVRSMELIHAHEPVARGLYAGSLGYISPEGDFDLNVVIRSLFYHEYLQQLYFQVGGAITWDSHAEAEYRETLVKAQAAMELFGK